MKLAKGDMWSAFAQADLFCITTNGTLNKKGELVMGAGIAKQAAQRFPDLARAAGDALSGIDWPEVYTLLLPFGARPEHPAYKLACFQVKRHFKEPADPDLIRRAVETLHFTVGNWELKNVHLNFPGIGLGGLRRADVLPLLEPLPACVTVWELE